MNLSIEEILAGRSVGRMQSVGPMQVIPILGEDDESFAPPDVDAGTSNYGQVHVRNRYDRDTIVPPGAAWIVDGAVQDHALGGGALVKAGSDRRIDRAMCIQQSQPGLIRLARHALHILPARLRVKAIELEGDSRYNRMWAHISAFKELYGLGSGAGNLVDFLRAFAKQLDEFVAEFELVPDQVGAIVLVGGKLVGIELAPSASYWEAVWVPLVRICYGAVALQAGRAAVAPPATRSVLNVLDGSLDGILAALDAAERAEEQVVRDVVVGVAKRRVKGCSRGVERLGGATLHTVEGRHLIGQVVTKGRGRDRVKYASLLASAA